jgi:hypothetical protein
LVTGSGAVRFAAPWKVGERSAKWIAPMTSSREIQLKICFPEPSLPPAPARKTGSILARAPDEGLSTTPVRSLTTRTPASSAGLVAASQASTTSARKPVPREADSSTGVSPRSP